MKSTGLPSRARRWPACRRSMAPDRSPSATRDSASAQHGAQRMPEPPFDLAQRRPGQLIVRVQRDPGPQLGGALLEQPVVGRRRRRQGQRRLCGEQQHRPRAVGPVGFERGRGAGRVAARASAS